MEWDELGNSKRLIGVHTDVTERKLEEDRLLKSVDEKEAVSRDIYDEVVRNLYLISAILDLEESRFANPSAKRSIHASKSRFLVHDLAYRRRKGDGATILIPVSEYLSELIPLLFKDLPVLNLTYAVDSDQASMGIAAAIRCGLALNEVLSSLAMATLEKGLSLEMRISFREELDFFVLSVGVESHRIESFLESRAILDFLCRELKGSRSLGKNMVLRFPKRIV